MLGFYTLVGSHGLSQFAVHLEDEINTGLYYVYYLLLYEYIWLTEGADLLEEEKTATSSATPNCQIRAAYT